MVTPCNNWVRSLLSKELQPQIRVRHFYCTSVTTLASDVAGIVKLERCASSQGRGLRQNRRGNVAKYLFIELFATGMLQTLEILIGESENRYQNETKGTF